MARQYARLRRTVGENRVEIRKTYTLSASSQKQRRENTSAQPHPFSRCGRIGQGGKKANARRKGGLAPSPLECGRPGPLKGRRVFFLLSLRFEVRSIGNNELVALSELMCFLSSSKSAFLYQDKVIWGLPARARLCRAQRQRSSPLSVSRPLSLERETSRDRVDLRRRHLHGPDSSFWFQETQRRVGKETLQTCGSCLFKPLFFFFFFFFFLREREREHAASTPTREGEAPFRTGRDSLAMVENPPRCCGGIWGESPRATRGTTPVQKRPRNKTFPNLSRLPTRSAANSAHSLVTSPRTARRERFTILREVFESGLRLVSGLWDDRSCSGKPQDIRARVAVELSI